MNQLNTVQQLTARALIVALLPALLVRVAYLAARRRVWSGRIYLKGAVTHGRG